jgi:hypothetical protein
MLRHFISAPERERNKFIQEYVCWIKAVNHGLAAMDIMRMEEETHMCGILALQAHPFSAMEIPSRKGKEHVLSR